MCRCQESQRWWRGSRGGGGAGELDLEEVRRGQIVKVGLKMSPGQRGAQEVHTSKPLVESFQEERNK